MSSYSRYFNDQNLLEKLEKLHTKKYQIKESLPADFFPYIVDVSGLPRTGKTLGVNRVYDFFKQAGIKIEKSEEPAFLIKQSLSIEEIRSISPIEFNDRTLQVSRKNLESLKAKKPNIILMDRGVIDNYFWYQMMYEDGTITAELYEQKLIGLVNDLFSIDKIFVLTALPEIVIMRDYVNQLYLETRTKTTLKRVEKLENGFNNLLPKIRKIISDKDKINCLDTSNISEIDTAIFLADKIMDGIQKKLS